MLYIRWGRGEREDTAVFLYVDNRTHRRIRLRIDIVSGNQLAIVSIPDDRLSEIGSRMIRTGEEAATRAGGTDRKR